MSLTLNYVYSLYDTINVIDTPGQLNYVGIGTTAPTELFSVTGGSIYVERMTNLSSNIDMAYSTLNNVQRLRSDMITSHSSSTINFNDNILSNVNTVRLNTLTSDKSFINLDTRTLCNIENAFVNTNLTVGQTLRTSNLEVIGDFTTLNTTTSNTEQMSVINAGSGPALIVKQTGQNPVASFYDDETIALFIGGTSADAGYIGINTAAPTSRLHMYDTTNLLAHIQTTTDGQAQVKMTNSNGSTTVGSASDGTIELMSTASQLMRIGTNSDASQLLLDVSGNIGIGTTSAGYKLDVSGTTRIQNAFYLTTNNMNTIFYSYGGQTFANGTKFIGLRLQWANTVTDNKLVFRSKVKCHLASDSSVAYRKFESLVTPKNDSATSRPNQVISTEIADTNNGDFGSMTHTVVRNAANAVDIKVSWTTAVASYLGNIQIEVFANTSLGDFTFTPING